MEQSNQIVAIKSSTNFQEGKIYRQWTVAILGNVTLLSYGLQVGWISSVANVLLSKESPTDVQLAESDVALLASAPNLAAITSIPVWSWLLDKFGRKPCIMYCAWVQLVAWLFLISSRTLTTLMIGRITGGVAGGGCVYIMPIYIQEITQDDLRGTLGMLVTTCRNLGVLAMHALGGFNMEYYTILWIALFVSVVSVFTVMNVPESPAYYFKIGKVDLASSTIAYLRNLNVEAKAVQDSVDSIDVQDKKFKSIQNISYISILKQKSWSRGFAFTMVLMFCSGLNGGLSIINFAPIILNVSQITLDPRLQSLTIPVCMTLGSLLSMLFIERVGRKPLLAASFLLSLLSFSAVAAILMMQQNGTEVPAWLAVLVVVVPVCSHAAAVSHIPFILAAEMFNFQIRAKMMGCLAITSWGSAFVQLMVFAPMSNAFGPHVTFILFAVVNLCGLVVVLVLFPETKKRSIEEIELELEKRVGVQ